MLQGVVLLTLPWSSQHEYSLPIEPQPVDFGLEWVPGNQKDANQSATQPYHLPQKGKENDQGMLSLLQKDKRS